MPRAMRRHDHAPPVTSHRGSRVWAGGGPLGLVAANAASAEAETDADEGVISGPVDMRGRAPFTWLHGVCHGLTPIRSSHPEAPRSSAVASSDVLREVHQCLRRDRLKVDAGERIASAIQAALRF